MERCKTFLLTFARRNGCRVNAMRIKHPSSTYLSSLRSKQSAEIHLLSTASTLTCFSWTFLQFFWLYFTFFSFFPPQSMTRQSSHISILKALGLLQRPHVTAHAQKLPCIQAACPIQLMSHVKWPFVLDFWTPNSLARPINFDWKYFRAQICHFNLLRKSHSFLRQGVNNTWQF